MPPLADAGLQVTFRRATPLDCEATLASGKLPRNAQLLQNLITAMERAGTKRLIFLSALGAAPHSPSAFLREKYLAEFPIAENRVVRRLSFA